MGNPGEADTLVRGRNEELKPEKTGGRQVCGGKTSPLQKMPLPVISTPEVWLRGSVPGLPPLLQPVAHALLQAREEVTALTDHFPEARLWDRPAGVASVGFHLQHLAGVLDRLFTYARGQSLTPSQLAALAAEGQPPESAGRLKDLVATFDRGVDRAMDQLRATPEGTLLEFRGVGRTQLPSTVLGLLVHAAEHTQRHVGQLLVTVRVLGGAPEKVNEMPPG